MHLIKRDIFPSLLQHLKQPEITIIVGPRQAGKTSLMQDLAEKAGEEGQRTLFLNLDVEDQAIFFETQRALINRLKAEFGSGRGVVFIDEIQRKINAGLFLKGLYDLNLPYKFVVSGSGSLELKEGISESMAGRKRLFALSTLSFSEFANFKTNYRYEGHLGEFLAADENAARELLTEYLIFGGYPRVILAETEKEKLATISEIFTSFVEKDITSLLGAEKRKEFLVLVKLLASQIGQPVNFSKLASLCGLDVKSVKKYLWYLEKTFIMEEVRPFSKNKRLEISRAPMFYFKDLGLRQYLADRFFSRDLKADILDASFVFQNFIFGLLTARREREMKATNIYYWRTKSGAEVDFVYGDILKQLPIEVKFSSFAKGLTVPAGLASFVEKYQPEEAQVLNLDTAGRSPALSSPVNFVPWYQMV